MADVQWTGRTVTDGKTRDTWTDGTSTDPATDPPKDRQR